MIDRTQTLDYRETIDLSSFKGFGDSWNTFILRVDNGCRYSGVQCKSSVCKDEDFNGISVKYDYTYDYTDYPFYGVETPWGTSYYEMPDSTYGDEDLIIDLPLLTLLDAGTYDDFPEVALGLNVSVLRQKFTSDATSVLNPRESYLDSPLTPTYNSTPLNITQEGYYVIDVETYENTGVSGQYSIEAYLRDISVNAIVKSSMPYKSAPEKTLDNSGHYKNKSDTIPDKFLPGGSRNTTSVKYSEFNFIPSVYSSANRAKAARIKAYLKPGSYEVITGVTSGVPGEENGCKYRISYAGPDTGMDMEPYLVYTGINIFYKKLSNYEVNMDDGHDSESHLDPARHKTDISDIMELNSVVVTVKDIDPYSPISVSIIPVEAGDFQDSLVDESGSPIVREQLRSEGETKTLDDSELITFQSRLFLASISNRTDCCISKKVDTREDESKCRVL